MIADGGANVFHEQVCEFPPAGLSNNQLVRDDAKEYCEHQHYKLYYSEPNCCPLELTTNMVLKDHGQAWKINSPTLIPPFNGVSAPIE